MNQTTNYNFNVPVGSDIVNPLVQDFPNWESLDTILRNVANTGITTATHTKSGTIHTLTFSETTVPMIRFQATADFNANDAFTVNGISVSALTVAGQALPDGAFVIGSMVLCELRDNLLTVYLSGTDAESLEGHPASYFATASDLSTVDGKTDANKTLIDGLEDMVDTNAISVVAGSSSFTNQHFFCRKIGHMLFTNFRFTTGSSQVAAGSAILGIDESVSNLITDQQGLSQAQQLHFRYGANESLAFTGAVSGDTRTWIFNGSTIPANTDITIFGAIMLR